MRLVMRFRWEALQQTQLFLEVKGLSYDMCGGNIKNLNLQKMLAKYSRYPLVANEGRFAGYDVGLSHSGTGRLIRWRSLRSKDDENIERRL